MTDPVVTEALARQVSDAYASKVVGQQCETAGCPPLLPGLEPMRVDLPPEVVTIRTPDLHGPVHDWFVVPRWVDAELHRSGIEHEHRP